MTVTDAHLAPAGGTQEPRPTGPKLLSTSGRVAPSLQTWQRPLPAQLWPKVAKQRRQAHEQLARAAEATIARSRALVVELRAARERDETQLQTAARKGTMPPPPAADAVARQLEEARARELETLNVLDRGGRSIAADVSDTVFIEMIAETLGEADESVTSVSADLEQALSKLNRAGELTHTATWMSRFVRLRRSAPFSPRPGAPPPGRLSTMAQHIRMALAEYEQYERERARRAAGPPEHSRPLTFAPEAGTMVPGPISPAA